MIAVKALTHAVLDVTMIMNAKVTRFGINIPNVIFTQLLPVLMVVTKETKVV